MKAWQVTALGLILTLGAQAHADPAKPAAARPAQPVSLDISAQPLGDALAAFAQQAGLQLVFYSSLGDGLNAPALKGSFTPELALERLLANTSLRYEFIDAQTVAIRTRKASATPTAQTISAAGPVSVDNGLVLAQVQSENAKAGVAKQERQEETSGEEEQEVHVTGSRIRSLLGEQTTQPVLTITREDIERYGVSSIGEVLRYIPQVSSSEEGHPTPEQGFMGAPPVNLTANRVTATLRGAPLGGTLLLVNGRRIPKTGQSTRPSGGGGKEGYDLAGIPLSAVERIDVLLDGASAIYGADAVGGVINVILRKDYRGTEARASYENTFDSDVGVTTLAVTHGFSAGKLSGLLTGSWENANEMMWVDRPFLSTFDRTAFGGLDERDIWSDGPAGTGMVYSYDGDLPGIGDFVAAIPAGSTGRNLTVADYANAGPLSEPFDFGRYSPYSFAYEHKSLAANVEYAFSPALTAFAEGRWGESISRSGYFPVFAYDIEIPAGAPGNPFGQSIYLAKWFTDLAIPHGEAITVNTGATAGVRGTFLTDWLYESAVSQVRARPGTRGSAYQIDPDAVLTALAGPNPPALLYDGTDGTPGNPPGTIESLTYPAGTNAERNRTTTYDAQADGPLFSLPAGAVRASFGAEYRQEDTDFPLSAFWLDAESYGRKTSGYYAEMRIPLVSARQSWPLVERIEASLAVRHDRYSDFPEATNPRYGLLYRPWRWLMLRASHGEGYKVPTLIELHMPEMPSTTFFPPGRVFDPARGGESITGLMDFTSTGNPQLRPERSENLTAGMVLELPFVTGLSFSFDYYDTRYKDRVGTLPLADYLVLFPEKIVRGPKPPGDPVAWLGPVISYFDQPQNIAVNRVSGYDISTKYLRPSEFGEWIFQATGTRTTRNEFRTAPNLPLSPLSTTSRLPMQVVGSVFWSRGALGAGTLFTYREAFGNDISGDDVPSAIRWDVQGSYDFGRTPRAGSWWGHLLADTRLSLTIFNVLNREPPFDTRGYFPDNTVVDSRLRRYSLSLVRKF